MTSATEKVVALLKAYGKYIYDHAENIVGNIDKPNYVIEDGIREDVESVFVSGYSLGTLPVGSDPQWDENRQTVDDEGYYRDGDGHYVVAASDMPEGTVFNGSKGECIVLDNGCDAGVTDYYVAF